MKNKKLMLVVTSLVMSAVSAFSFAACDSNGGGGGTGNEGGNGGGSGTGTTPHVHEYVWGEYTIEPTCEDPGVQKGVCPADNTPTTRPVDPIGHAWGDWKITEPTASETGLATLECANDTDKEHVQRVVLPALSEVSEYTIKDGEDNEKIYTYANSIKDITFVVTPVAQEEYSVEDAVNYGTADSKHALVRSGEGKFGSLKVSNTKYSDVSYVYGEDYVYVDDGSMNEKRYYEKDDESDSGVFAVKDYNGQISIDTIATANNLIGPEFYLTYVTRGDRYYGVEGLVKGFYEWGKTNGVRDFTEYDVGTFDEEYGKEKVFSFSFNFINVNYDSYYTVVTVDFTLNASNVIDWVKVQGFSYIQAEYTGNETEGYTPTDSADPYYDVIEMTQTMKSEDDEEPVNPYSKKDVTEIKYTYGSSTTLEEGATVDFTPNTAFYFNVKLPQNAIAGLSDIRCYLIGDNGAETECTLFSNTDAMFYYNKETSIITMQIKLAGDFKVVFRSSASSITFNIHANKVAPSTLHPNVYSYSEAADTYNASVSSTATVYVGKKLMFNTSVSNPNTEDPGYTASVTSAPGGADYSLTDSTYKGNDVTEFVTDTAGTYTITLTSTLSSSTYSTISVTVKDVPDMAEALSGTYENTANGITVVFTPAEEGATNGTVEISDANGTDVLTYSSDGADVTSEYSSGSDLGYRLAFNDVYSLVLVRNDGHEDETFSLKAVAEDGTVSLSGTTWLSNKSSAGTQYTLVFLSDTEAYINMYAMYHYFSYSVGDDGTLTISASSTNAAKNKEGMNEYFTIMSSPYTLANKDSYVGDGEIGIRLLVNSNNANGEMMVFTLQS